MKQNIYSVSQVNRYIKNMFTQDFVLKSIAVKGEVSNCTYHGSGHIYFTLKDQNGSISCVMFAGNRRSGLKFQMKEGDDVIVLGNVNVFERSGQYQLYASQISLAGLGDLYRQFEELKEKLMEMGMFDVSYKQAIPRFAKRIGVVTAPTGAAIRDIQNISGRRNPYVQMILYPALVQGDGAIESIVRGIETMDRMGLDVLIVGRGGGSIEDLWAFNTEPVARAIFECQTPVISAVGHETDTTIADMVADMRAPTPSAAAELAVFDIQELLHSIVEKKQRLDLLISRRIDEKWKELEQLKLKLTMNSPQQKFRDHIQTLDEITRNLERAVEDKIYAKKHQLELLASALDGLSPLKRLQSGSAFLTDEAGHTRSEFQEIQVGDHLKIHMLEGIIDAEVLDKTTIDRGESHEYRI